MKKKVIRIFLITIIFLSIIPYFIPITSSIDLTSEKPFPESKFTKINGIALHYRAFIPDNPKGKILMVHGMGGSTFSWRNNIDYLVESDYIVILVDLPGFGFSDRQRGIDHSQVNRSFLLWKLLDEIDNNILSDPMNNYGWNLVGHSMGGGTIAAMAIENRERVETLIFVAGAVYQSPRKLMSILLSYPPNARWFQVIGRYFIKEKNFVSLLESAFNRPPTKEEVRGYYIPFATPGTEGAFVDISRTSSNIDLDKLAIINSPALLIWGDSDSWVPLEQGKRLLSDIENGRLEIILESGHCPMETHYEEFNIKVIEFLSIKSIQRP